MLILPELIYTFKLETQQDFFTVFNKLIFFDNDQ